MCLLRNNTQDTRLLSDYTRTCTHTGMSTCNHMWSHMNMSTHKHHFKNLEKKERKQLVKMGMEFLYHLGKVHGCLRLWGVW